MKNFEDAIKLADHERKREIISRLNEYTDKDLFSLFCEANSWDGSFDFVNAYELEDLCSMISDNYGLVCSVIYGNVTNAYEMVRYNAYGNLENVSKWDLEEECRDRTDELAEWLLDNWNEVYSLYEEDEELFRAWCDIDTGRYEDEE